jgi:hypothetical protein
VWDVVSNEEAVRVVAQDKGNPATVSDRFIEVLHPRFHSLLRFIDRVMIPAVCIGERGGGVSYDSGSVEGGAGWKATAQAA